MIHIPNVDGSKCLLILNPQDLDRLRAGKALATMDGRNVLMMTPDQPYVERRIHEAFEDGIVSDAALFKTIIA